MLLLQAGRMLGELVAQKTLSGKQAKGMISSAAALAAKAGSCVRCMHVSQIRARFSHAYKAGIEDQQRSMISWPGCRHDGLLAGDGVNDSVMATHLLDESSLGEV